MFNEAYRHMLRKEVFCPRCKTTNVTGASDTIVVNDVGTRAECTNCSFERPIEAFMPQTFRERQP